MSKEIKCPKCGEVFKIDESSYSDLLSQIKESEIVCGSQVCSIY